MAQAQKATCIDPQKHWFQLKCCSKIPMEHDISFIEQQGPHGT